VTDAEPRLITERGLLPILRELRDREPLFHRLELGTRLEDLEQQVDVDFWEVGASGRGYSREFVLSTLQERYSADAPDEWATSGFHCRSLAADTYLLTYTLAQGHRVSRRCTIWRRTAAGWQALYHQGTPVQG
jgi:hypothetical protein